MSDKPELVSFREAGRRMGISSHVVRRIVNRRLLSEVRIPGCRPRVSWVEIRDLIEASTTPALIYAQGRHK